MVSSLTWSSGEYQDQVFEDRVELLHSIRECQVELNEVPLVFVPFRDRSVSYRNKHKHGTAYPGVRLGLGSLGFLSRLEASKVSRGKDLMTS